jgi:precorrin-8X/cobalt-precorrin-8 methylmutase
MQFDAYVIVDWSANSRPKRGRDSIWWCAAAWEGGGLQVDTPVNVATRKGAIGAIGARLEALVEDRRSVLVGFDFPYAYPRGFAAALGLRGEPWRAVWDELSRLIVDEQERSKSNRFDVAAELNARLAGAGPFWGCPLRAQRVALRMTKASMPCASLQFRAVERRTRGPKSGWQLFFNGAAGSQALLGIPYLARLRDDPALAPVSAVWPFETGAALPARVPGRARVIHAEIYPSAIPFAPAPDEVKDAAQVRTLAAHFAARDRSGELEADFAAPAIDGGWWREEGWILGVR